MVIKRFENGAIVNNCCNNLINMGQTVPETY